MWHAGGVAISFDSATAAGTAEEVAALVDAVLAASRADELDWIEWKGSLDLGDKTVRGILARHILGMANRLPQQAGAHAAGRDSWWRGQSPGTALGSRSRIRPTCRRALIPSWVRSGRRGRCIMTIALACRSS